MSNKTLISILIRALCRERGLNPRTIAKHFHPIPYNEVRLCYEGGVLPGKAFVEIFSKLFDVPIEELMRIRSIDRLTGIEPKIDI